MQEFQARKARQDGVLDDIEAGLGNLQNIAKDMGNEMQKQDILVDEIDTNVRPPPTPPALSLPPHINITPYRSSSALSGH